MAAGRPPAAPTGRIKRKNLGNPTSQRLHQRVGATLWHLGVPGQWLNEKSWSARYCSTFQWVAQILKVAYTIHNNSVFRGIIICEFDFQFAAVVVLCKQHSDRWEYHPIHICANTCRLPFTKMRQPLFHRIFLAGLTEILFYHTFSSQWLRLFVELFSIFLGHISACFLFIEHWTAEPPIWLIPYLNFSNTFQAIIYYYLNHNR